MARKREKRLYYVSVMDGGDRHPTPDGLSYARRHGFLLGPYRTHKEALANVARGRALALEADAFAWFYAYGTASVPVVEQQPKTVFAIDQQPTTF